MTKELPGYSDPDWVPPWRRLRGAGEGENRVPLGRLTVTMSPGSWPDESVLACEILGRSAHYTGMLDVDAPYAVHLPEGTYVVRVALPSGAFLSSVAQVADDEDTHVELGASVDVSSRGEGSAPEPPTSGSVSRGPLPGVGHRPHAALPPPPVRQPPPAPPSRQPTRQLFARLWLGALTSTWSGTPEVDDSGAVVARLSTGPGPYSVQVGGPDVAWRTVRLPPSYGARLTVVRSPDDRGFDDGVHVSVTGSSPLAASMFTYLAAGQLDSAQIVAPDLLDGAKRLFQEKAASPEGAAAAGYFLLRTGQQETIGDWPENFANWFGWLPDASVIHAWQLLRRPGVPERDVARARLLAAARAGVPVYTEGLRLLFQGLQLLAGPDDDAVQEALTDVRAYAAACDWDAVHTTYWGERPDAPGLQRRTGWPSDPNGWVTLPTATP